MEDLSGYSADALIAAIIRLTHAIANAKRFADQRDYRDRRDLARAELLRRCKEHSHA